MILFDSPNLKIEFKNVPCRHLLTTWRGLPVSELYQDGISEILRCCHENEISKLLSDIRSLERVTEKDQRFEDGALRAFSQRHGRLYHAVILSSEVFLEFSLTTFDRVESEQHPIQQFFSNTNDALLWFQEIDGLLNPIL